MQNQNREQPIHRILDDKKRSEIVSLLNLGFSRRKAAQYVGCAPSSQATQRPSNGLCDFTATTQSTTPETTTSSATQQNPKNATPIKGVAQTVLHSPESYQQEGPLPTGLSRPIVS
jgi:hypothetical protein